MDRIERSAHARDFFPRDRHPEVEETILLLLSPPSERRKQRDGECAVVHGVCAITMLITNIEGSSFSLLFVRHLSRMPQFSNALVLLLLLVKRSTGSGSFSDS